MTMAPFEARSDELKRKFLKLQDLQLEIRKINFNMPLTDFEYGYESFDYKKRLNLAQHLSELF